jgi:ubiquinone/menaquinone biosynthesis C-methylase UbiE
MERILKPGGLCCVNFISEEDPDERPFCKNVPAQDLLKSERFAKYEDDEADSYLARFSIVRKEKR